MVQPKKSHDPTPIDSSTLSALHQHTIAVRLEVPGHNHLFVGRGILERDRNLGRILRVQFPSDDDTEIVLVESDWNGEILSGEAAGCDYLIQLTSRP
jgi:hypothetical protein